MRWVAVLAISLAFAPHLAWAQDDAAANEERAFDLMVNEDRGDDVEARQLMQRAADNGSVEAINALSTMFLNGIGGPQDTQRGIALLEQAAERGSIGANLTLSDSYIRGINGYDRDPARGYRHAVAAAESNGNPRGVAYAQWLVGMLTLNGVGTTRDAARAYEWVSRAAENGGVSGMVSRAVMLATGEGVTADPPAAREWYRRAAESGQLGSAHGLRGLGAMLALGEGGPVDLSTGYAYLQLAQEAGDENAAQIISMITPQLTARHRAEAEVIIGAWRIQHPPLQPDRVGARIN